MTPTTICVPWMTGRRNVRIVSARVRDLPGVDLVHADPGKGTLVVLGRVTAEHVRTAVSEIAAAAGGLPVLYLVNAPAGRPVRPGARANDATLWPKDFEPRPVTLQ